MSVLDNINPQAVFSYFEDICSIPHGSGNTVAISEYLVDFAISHGLKYIHDSSNNVVIFKDGSIGYENSPSVILQAHTDMVCEKESNCNKDMSKEGLDIICDGDYITAKGTTLGADNGIGVAYIMAVLASDDIAHPPLEAVFTVDEEVGLLGAFSLDTKVLKSKLMINLDTECENEFTVSCAGGITSKTIFDSKREQTQEDFLKITIKGLSGGHSGVVIGNGGANSNVLIARALMNLRKQHNIRLVSIDGGFKDNAIPVETSAIISSNDIAGCKKTLATLLSEFKNEYRATDPKLDIVFEEAEKSTSFTTDFTDKLIAFLNSIPNGVYSMSHSIENLVQTSSNFAIISTTDELVEINASVRSSIKSQKMALADKIAFIADSFGGKTTFYGEYPGWEYADNSRIRDTMTASYKKVFKKQPMVIAIHAGLECGLFSEKIPGLDCISYGPDIKDIHTPREALSISSTQRVWEILLDTLKRLK